jgi:hypothetical protein
LPKAHRIQPCSLLVPPISKSCTARGDDQSGMPDRTAVRASMMLAPAHHVSKFVKSEY